MYKFSVVCWLRLIHIFSKKTTYFCILLHFLLRNRLLYLEDEQSKHKFPPQNKTKWICSCVLDLIGILSRNFSSLSQSWSKKKLHCFLLVIGIVPKECSPFPRNLCTTKECVFYYLTPALHSSHRAFYKCRSLKNAWNNSHKVELSNT